MIARGLVVVGVLAVLILGSVAASAHASARRRERSAALPVIVAVARALPGPDLAMAGGSRHLRHLSREEPGAAFADGPASLDADPAGGAVAPPAAVWAEEATRSSRGQ